MHYLEEHATFNGKQSLNKAVYEHIKRNSPDLNETDRSLFKAIARYAVKFPGAAHLKAETLAGFIGKTIKTARRIVNKLSSLGIIEKVPTLRKVNGGKGANIIRILPIDVQSSMSSREVAENAPVSREHERNSDNEPSYLIKLLSTTKVLDTATVDSSALKNSLPSPVYKAFSTYFNADDIYEYYGLMLRAKRKINAALLFEDCPEPFVEAIHAVVLKAKRGVVRNLSAYFYSAFESATAQAGRIIGANNNEVYYDWLADV